MNPIVETFAALRARRETGLVPYCMGGYPTLDRSIELMRSAAAAGADVIEIGVPFSDPVADGRSIQFAGQVALEQGFKLRDLLARLAAAPLACPAVLMSYLNPLLAYGRDALLGDLVKAGVAGLLVPDLPADEADDWREAAAHRGIGMIFLVAPTSSDERIRRAADASEGFVYAVARAGTTGVRDHLDVQLPEYLGRIRSLTDKPIAVGFGISSPQQAAALRDRADAIVIGSCLIDSIRGGRDPSVIIRACKYALRS